MKDFYSRDRFKGLEFKTSPFKNQVLLKTKILVLFKIRVEDGSREPQHIISIARTIPQYSWGRINHGFKNIIAENFMFRDGAGRRAGTRPVPGRKI